MPLSWIYNDHLTLDKINIFPNSSVYRIWCYYETYAENRPGVTHRRSYPETGKISEYFPSKPVVVVQDRGSDLSTGSLRSFLTAGLTTYGWEQGEIMGIL